MSQPLLSDEQFQDLGAADNWIGGQFIPPVGGTRRPVENPRFARVLGNVAVATEADVAVAVTTAAEAATRWRAVPVKERAETLSRFKTLLQRDLDQLGWLVAHENGKTFAEGKAEVEKGIECVDFAASVPNLPLQEHLDVSRGVNCRVVHEPLGVVAGITPFNFPVMVPLWMIPLALVAGNSFILKPSDLVPFGATRIATLLAEAGLPPGVFSVVNGGAEVVNALVDHPLVRAAAFVGSTPVARLLYTRGSALGKPMLCLGGAKNHLIVVPDADPALTAPNVVASFTGCAGQRCMAASVLLAVGDSDAIVAEVVRLASRLELGRDLGPVISAAALTRITSYVDDAERRGARVVLDGRGRPGPGYWFGPTILDHCTTDMPASCEEIFGPVLSIIRVATVDEALRIENANPHGNAASVYTSSGAVAAYVSERVEAGMVGVNVGVPVPREPFGFGGWNQSRFGVGNITGTDGYRFWTRPRKVTTKWQVQADWNWMS